MISRVNAENPLVVPARYFEDTLISVYNQAKQRREARIGYVTIEGNK